MKYAAIIITLLSLSACSSLSIQQTHVTLTGTSDTKTFTYSDKSLSDEFIIKSLVNQMVNHSLHPKSRKQSGKVFILKGIDAYLSPGQIMLTYFNGSQHTDTGIIYGTKINVPFTYQFSSDENLKYLTLIPPKHYDVIPGRNILMLPFDRLLSNKQVFEDIQRIYRDTNSNLLLMSTVTGELNSPYPIDSIKTNFERMLGHTSYNRLTNIFKLPFRNSFIPLSIRFYPYQNGSKISYSFDYPYQENSDATNTFNAQEVAYLKSVINNVVNN